MTIKNYILLSISTLMLAGCTSEDINNTQTDERLPLQFEATLSSGTPVTRAYDNTLEENDKLLCYVRHIYGTGKPYTPVLAKMVNFTIGSTGINPDSPLYWDDFSKSDTETNDLRTSGHGLQSYYGYCYNGGSPTTALVEATGVLGWTTADDQTDAAVMKKNDLLWSAEQSVVTYNHAKGAHGTLTIPYTHAMSKFTIELKAGDGFKAGGLENTTITLKNVSKVGAFNAPEGKVEVTGTTDVKMYSEATDAAATLTRTYEAMTVPQTALTEGAVIAKIVNADGNSYDIKISKDMLGTSAPVQANNWSAGIDDNGKTISGYNYKLTVTINKQNINVVASLIDWNTVATTANGEIQFTADVTDSGKTNDATLNDGDAFSLWMTKVGETVSNTPTTTSTYNKTDNKFSNSTAIYWPNITDSYYFRALAEMVSGKIKAVTNTTVSQGTDLLWGTTAAHSGYAEGAAINPRTGDVPLVFKHAMSKVIIILSTVDASNPAYVDLSKATFQLTNLASSGTIALTDGTITPAATSAAAVSDGKSSEGRIMIPQTIGNNAKLIINLHDGNTDAESTTYSLQLKKCEDSSNKTITTWTSGNKYTYTINLQKEDVKFRVMVEKWKENTGSGNATLDWD